MEDDDIIAQQAKMAAEKFGGLKKKNPMVGAGKPKKQFDSADYFKNKEGEEKKEEVHVEK